MKKLDAGEFPLGNFLSSDFKFVILDYQRPYSLGTERALQLLDDLDLAIDRDPDEQEMIHSHRRILATSVRSDLKKIWNEGTEAF